jgi:hypothetical protein
MYPQDVAGASGCVCPAFTAAAKKSEVLRLPMALDGLSAGDALVCGQSRTTIKARHFASLIGRLWIGGF